MAEKEDIEFYVEKVTGDKAFGHSKSYRSLLRYLVTCTLKNDIPKETAIAIDVFGKDHTFDPSENTMVRVYVHNLRKKLETYYRKSGENDAIKFEIQKGNYAVTFLDGSQQLKEENKQQSFKKHRLVLPVLVALLLISLIMNLWLGFFSESEPRQNTASTQFVWDVLAGSQKPVLIVVGDLFFFGEVDSLKGGKRIVRHYDINTEEDLEKFIGTVPRGWGSMKPLDDSFVNKGVAYSLQYILPVLEAGNREVHIRLMSKLTPEDIRDNNLVYIGLYKAMGLLQNYFTISHYDYLRDTDELFNRETSDSLWIEGDPLGYHADYGCFSRFRGPNNNWVFLIAGFTDTGVNQTAKNFTQPDSISAFQEKLLTQLDSIPPSFEAFYEVSGYDRTEIDTRLRFVRPLQNEQDVWKVKGEH